MMEIRDFDTEIAGERSTFEVTGKLQIMIQSGFAMFDIELTKDNGLKITSILGNMIVLPQQGDTVIIKNDY